MAALATVVAAYAGGMAISQSIPKYTSSSRTEEKEKSATIPKGDTVIYRSGSKTNYNLTPREADTKGLSFSLTPPPTGKYVVTTINEVNATGILHAEHKGTVHLCCSQRLKNDQLVDNIHTASSLLVAQFVCYCDNF